MFFHLIFIIYSIYIVASVDVLYIDRSVYSRVFKELSNTSLSSYLTYSKMEPLYLILVKLITHVTSDLTVFYILLYLALITILLIGLKKICGFDYSVIVFFLFINYFTYYGYVLNGIRQGFSMVLLILMIAYALKNNRLKMLLVGTGAIFFHYSSIPAVLGILIIYYFKNLKVQHLLWTYLISSFIYIFEPHSNLLSSLNIDYLEIYSSPVDGYDGSNNMNFLFFNTFFLLIFLFCSKRYRDSKIYIFLFKTYICFSIYFLVFGFISFPNRIVAYSWFIIPLLIGFLIKKGKSKLLKIFFVLFFVLTGIIAGVPNLICN